VKIEPLREILQVSDDRNFVLEYSIDAENRQRQSTCALASQIDLTRLESKAAQAFCEDGTVGIVPYPAILRSKMTVTFSIVGCGFVEPG
jgi:hypothetical protein